MLPNPLSQQVQEKLRVFFYAASLDILTRNISVQCSNRSQCLLS
jgi:hypothetical protein